MLFYSQKFKSVPSFSHIMLFWGRWSPEYGEWNNDSSSVTEAEWWHVSAAFCHNPRRLRMNINAAHFPPKVAAWIRALNKTANITRNFTITEKVPTRAFSWLKAFTFKKLLRHYAIWALERDEAPEHQHTAITSPYCHELMVWRIFSVVTIFLSPLMDKFTLMEV